MGYRYKEGVVCAIAECGNLRSCRDWCHKHYKRWQLHGDPLKLLQHDCKGKKCAAKGCDRDARKVGLCNSHYTAEWRKENPELAKKNIRNSWVIRGFRKRAAEGYHSWQEWESLVADYSGLCAYCSTAPAESRDHVIPISRGGSNNIENILPACLTCNKTKNARTVEEWHGNRI